MGEEDEEEDPMEEPAFSPAAADSTPLLLSQSGRAPCELLARWLEELCIQELDWTQSGWSHDSHDLMRLHSGGQ